MKMKNEGHEIKMRPIFSTYLYPVSGTETSGSKFSTTWRPAGDYIHLKITFLVQNTTVQVTLTTEAYAECLPFVFQVGGSSFLLWAIENYQEFSELAENIAEKEVIKAKLI